MYVGASPPRHVTDIGSGYAAGMELNWIPPRYPNGNIMGYIVKYNMKNGTEIRVNVTINYYTLKEGQTYKNIAVMAVNEAGIGEESKMLRQVKVP